MSESLRQRFRPQAVFWRRFLAWASSVVPPGLYIPVLALWAGLFYAFWTTGRRAVQRNLAIILPGSSRIANFFRSYRVFWTFAWTITETEVFHEQSNSMDWEIDGVEALHEIADDPNGAILLTAHMGNYDLGACLFTRKLGRRLTMIRVPEIDPEAEAFVSTRRERSFGQRLKVHYNIDHGATALGLLDALRSGEVIAIQGDRVLPGLASIRCDAFGHSIAIPSGPFALAMAARTRVYPMLIMRTGWRRYRVVTAAPIEPRRRGRDRDADIAEAMNEWVAFLEQNIRQRWWQWFHFADLRKESP